MKRFGDSMLFLCLESKKHPDAVYYIWTKVFYGYNSSLELNLTRKQHSSSQCHIIPLLQNFPEMQWHMWSSGLSTLLAVTDYISHTKRSKHLNSQWWDSLPKRKHNKTALSDAENWAWVKGKTLTHFWKQTWVSVQKEHLNGWRGWSSVMQSI